MARNLKISGTQLAFMIISFIYGSSSILNPAVYAYQDAWLSYLVGWAGGYILIWMYSHISTLNPSKSLVEILKDTFGEFMGFLISLLYIWYFIHLASLVLRNFAEFSLTVNYPETPIIFVIICLTLLTVYGMKSGIEVVARVIEILVPIMIPFVLLTSVILLNRFDLSNLLPLGERGLKPILKGGFSVMALPYGEIVVFLMIFPYLNYKKSNIKRLCFFSITIAGIVLFISLMRDLLALGPGMLTRSIFPSHLSARLIPGVHVDPLIDAALLVGGGFKITIFFYAAIAAITELFNLDDYRILALPVATVIVPLSVWVFDNIFGISVWTIEIFPYYSFPFQVIIPLLVLIISLIKKKKQAKVS